MKKNELDRILDRAHKLIEQRDWAEALAVLDELIHLDAEYVDAWYQKGKILNRLGRLEEALDAFENMVNINPEDCDGWYSKGVILSKMGRTEASLEAYQEARRLNPESSSQAGLEGIDFLGILGRDQSALEGFERIAASEESNVYVNKKFMYRVDLSFVWDDGLEETLVIEELSESNVAVRSSRYPQCSFNIESDERIPCNYPAKELGRDLAAETAASENEISFYVFSNGQIPAYAVRTQDEMMCDIIVMDQFTYNLKRTLFKGDKTSEFFSKHIPALFRPFHKMV